MKIFLVAALFATTAHAEPSLQELSSLVARGHSEGKASCGHFRKKWVGMVKGGLTRESPSHVSVEQSMEALKLFEKYPGRAADAAKAWNYLVDNEEALEKLPEQKQLVDELFKIEPACEQYSHYTHLTLLMKDLTAFPLSKKDKKRILAVVRKHLKDENTDTQLVPLGMKINELNTFLNTAYEGDNKEALKPKASALVADLEAARGANEQAMSALAQAGKHDTLEYSGPELKAWKRLHDSYHALLAEVQF